MDGFGARLVAAREKKGLSQTKLAELLKITPTRLNYWEKDKREPDFYFFSQILKILDANADELLGLSTYGDKKIEPFLPDDEGIALYKKLDENDKAEIRGEMKQMLKAEKYNKYLPIAARGGGVSKVKLTDDVLAAVEEELPELLDDAELPKF